MGENHSKTLPDILSKRSEPKLSSELLNDTHINTITNIIQELDKIFLTLTFETYIPTKNDDYGSKDEICENIQKTLYSIFKSIPPEHIDDIIIEKMKNMDEFKSLYETHQIDTKCRYLSDFYSVLYITIQDILRVVSPHYVYKKNGEKQLHTFPIYEEKYREYMNKVQISLENKNDTVNKVIDMNPCKQRLLMYYFETDSNKKTIQFGIRDPFTRQMDADIKDYGIQALKNLYKDIYNPVTKSFEDSSTKMKELMYLQMQDITENNMRIGKIIEINDITTDNTNNDVKIKIIEKYNAYVASVHKLHKHYTQHIEKINLIIKKILNIQQTTTLKKYLSYKDILSYRKDVNRIIIELYDTCDVLSGETMDAYNDLYDYIDESTSELKAERLQKQIEEFASI